MSGTPGSCGIGGWGGPVPGDPDNDLTLAAVAVFGGIRVSWTYPVTNPHAVAHVLVYRGVTNVFANAVEIATVKNSNYLDPIDIVGTYYYWIKMVTVNGTVNDEIGPVACTLVKTRSDWSLEDITERIDNGVLAESLRTDIAKITLNYDELLAEIANRIDGDTALSGALGDLQEGLTEAIGFISTEQTVRQEGDEALASQIDLIAAANSDNAAAIITETTARVTADEAMATQITSLFAATGDNAAAIITEQTARTTADTALAAAITTAQTTLDGNIASVQTTLQTNINTVEGVVTEIGALYTVKVTVNGLVGGFGIYNSGAEIEAGFDVDTFWVGKTLTNRVKPFVITGGVVYIDSARIANASITNAHIANLSVSTLKIAEGSVTSMSFTQAVGPTSVPASGSLLLGTLDVNMGSAGSPSGIVLHGHAVLQAVAGDATDYLRIIKVSGGAIIGASVVSILNGFAEHGAVFAFDPTPSNGVNSYQLYAVNATSGPGSATASFMLDAAFTAIGGKR